MSDKAQSDRRPREPTNPPAAGSPSLVGRVLGGYRLAERIGAGAMGKVFRAAHLDSGRPAAVKVLRPECTEDPIALKRLKREASAVSEIGHPNIVEIIDFGRDHRADPPLVFLVLELLEGENLKEAISRDRALDPLSAVQIGRQIADALVAVHRAGILHRDLKPENIFLLAGPQDAEPEVKLLDFGIVKALDPADQTLLTIPGETVGTPDFMPPEQLRGETLDQRTEVYAVGLLLYNMLTGDLPFATVNLGRLLLNQLHKPPPPLSEKRPPDLPPVPAPLWRIVRRCLAGDPKKRYQDAGKLMRALSRCEKQIATSAAGPGSGRWLKMAIPALLAAGALLWWLLVGP